MYGSQMIQAQLHYTPSPRMLPLVKTGGLLPEIAATFLTYPVKPSGPILSKHRLPDFNPNSAFLHFFECVSESLVFTNVSTNEGYEPVHPVVEAHRRVPVCIHSRKHCYSMKFQLPRASNFSLSLLHPVSSSRTTQ